MEPSSVGDLLLAVLSAPAAAPPPPPTGGDSTDDDDDDDDGPITWYKHRETKLPDSNVVHQKLASPEVVRAPSDASAGSAWNAAGTWEEKDVLPRVKTRVAEVLKAVAPRDFGAGLVSFDRVKEVTGDASVGVIRGRKRQFVDLQIEVARPERTSR
mmetsp:Transcript_21980/g.65900  ORF Transcript_21980/g.65900 Transcript_21980/m.65900 type:complete len:156 (+) Transcript_21980:1380-1847(+)